VSILTIFLSW